MVLCINPVFFISNMATFEKGSWALESFIIVCACKNNAGARIGDLLASEVPIPEGNRNYDGTGDV